MNLEFIRTEMIVWGIWVVTWFVAALWRGTQVSVAPRREFRVHFLVIIAGFYLMALPIPGVPRLWQVTPALGWMMVALCVAGFAFAWWARIHMGRLWSGNVVAMEGHRVVQSGPFALVRHPIYTGMGLSAIAIALTSAQPTAFLGAGLFILGFALKARVEERFLEAELGGYEEYRRRVPMLVPGLRPRG